MKNYALDSNIVSYYLKGNEELMDKIDYETTINKIIIPPVVYFEIRRELLYLKSRKKLEAFEEMFLEKGIDAIDRQTLDKAADIYIQLRNMKPSKIVDDADLLIAAYCLQNDCILVTNNTKHFEHIESLQFENWIE